MISVQYDPLQVMGTITRRFHYSPLETARGVAETRPTIEKLLKVITVVKLVQRDLDKI